MEYAVIGGIRSIKFGGGLMITFLTFLASNLQVPRRLRIVSIVKGFNYETDISILTLY